MCFVTGWQQYKCWRPFHRPNLGPYLEQTVGGMDGHWDLASGVRKGSRPICRDRMSWIATSMRGRGCRGTSKKQKWRGTDSASFSGAIQVRDYYFCFFPLCELVYVEDCEFVEIWMGWYRLTFVNFYSNHFQAQPAFCHSHWPVSCIRSRKGVGNRECRGREVKLWTLGIFHFPLVGEEVANSSAYRGLLGCRHRVTTWPFLGSVQASYPLAAHTQRPWEKGKGYTPGKLYVLVSRSTRHLGWRVSRHPQLGPCSRTVLSGSVNLSGSGHAVHLIRTITGDLKVLVGRQTERVANNTVWGE